MPLLQGQPFRLIKPPDSVEPGTKLYVIQHTGEKFVSKSDYEDRLALYSQSIWTCQCTGKSGLTHQEAWTSEAKIRVLLSSSFPTPLLQPILRTLHHSTLPLDQLVEAAANLCYSRFHPGEELTLLGLQPMQVRVISSKESNNRVINAGNMANGKETSPLPKTPATPLTNGCSPHACEGSMVNGTRNGTAGNEELSPTSGGKGKDDSPGKKKNPLLPLLYDVSVIGEDKIMTDVPAKYLQRTYKVPPKEHFRLFVRANAIRQRSSAYTPWLVSEELVKLYNIPNKLASIFTHPRTNSVARKRKAEGLSEEKPKKAKGEKTKESVKRKKADPASKSPKVRKPKEKRDPNAPRKKPGPKPGFKRTPKPSQNSEPPKPSVKLQKLVKIETSDSDDNVSLAVLANKSPKLENGTSEQPKVITPPGIAPLAQPMKKEVAKDGKEHVRGVRKMKQATLFDLKTPKKNTDGTPKPKVTPKKSPQKRRPTAEAVMRIPIMKKMVHQYSTLKGVKGTGRKLVHTMDQVIKKLSLHQIEVIPDAELRERIMSRHERMLEKNTLAKLSPEEKENYLKQKAKDEARKRRQFKQERNRKIEDKLLGNLKPLPQPPLVPTPEEIPNSLFGDVAMVVEFLECYYGIVHTDKKKSISCSQLMQALAAGPNGFKYVAEVMCLILHLIIDDIRLGGIKEVGVKIKDLPVHYQTAIELARLCLSKRDFSESASQHSDDNTEEGEEQNELSDGLIHKLESSDLYELQPAEVIAVLKALCHQAIASDTVLEHVEDIEEKAYTLYKERAQLKKMSLKAEMEKKELRKQERLQKKIDKTKSPKKTPGRPKGYSPKKKAMTLDNFYGKKEDENNTDLASRVKRRRLTAEELNKEKELNKNLQREQMEKEEEEKRRLLIVQECERVLMQKDMLIRLQPLGVDRNHDRYWLFNNTTPGLYVEKGWVDPNTTYSLQSGSPKKKPPTSVSRNSITNGNEDSGSDSDDKPLAAIKEELSTSNPKQEHVLSKPKLQMMDEDNQTFPPVGQNMWFYYNSLERVDELLESLADKGIRESKLKISISQVKAQLEVNLTKEWSPLEDLEDGGKQLVESLREDIIQIERELSEGWLGAVSDPEAWEKKAKEATTLQELGECLMEAQKHMHFKYLKGMMQPSKKLIPSDNPEAAPEYDEWENPAVHKWREAVMTCQTFSRMHMLVGMFDSCIKWEKSIATKKCKVCRHQHTTTPLAICEKCEVSYHWSCLRPQLREEPPEPWLCPGCQPQKNSRLERHKRNQEYDPSEKEKVCRVCVRGLGLIFCCKCPAAYHSECHDPPLQTRARKDWACVNCTRAKKRKGFKYLVSTKVQYQSESEEEMVTERKSTSKSSTKATRKKKTVQKRGGGRGRSLRCSSRKKYVESDDEGNEDDTDFVATTRQRRSARTTTTQKKNYKIISDEEDDNSEQEKEVEENNMDEEEENAEQDEENMDEDEEEEDGEQDEEEEDDNGEQEVEEEEEEEDDDNGEQEEDDDNGEQEVEEEEEEEDNVEQEVEEEEEDNEEEEDEEGSEDKENEDEQDENGPEDVEGEEDDEQVDDEEEEEKDDDEEEEDDDNEREQEEEEDEQNDSADE